MKALSISGSPRANVGKKEAKNLRRQKLIPCILYGGKEQIAFSAPEEQFVHLIYTPQVHTVNITVNGKEYHAKIQELQFHPVDDKLLHVDFLELFPDKAVTMDIPVKLYGSAAGVKAGGKLVTNIRRLKVRALPGDLPDTIDINIENLEIGKNIRVGDMNSDKLKFLDAPNVVICTVKVTRATAAAANEADAKGKAAKK